MADASGLRLVRELGRGGFGVTFLAEVQDPDLRAEFGAEKVALKIPRDPAAGTALRREILTMARIADDLRGLPQANLVRFLGFLPIDGVISLVMELVEGGSLRTRVGGIGHQRSMRPAEAISIVDGVLAGLSALHANHVVHRDIKPENILMQGDLPKIADLGISRIVRTGDLTNTRAGTVFYMSPESLEGDCGPAADLWATGVVLYELLTGQLPFGGPKDPLMVVARHVQKGSFAPLRQVRSDLPAALDEIVARMLHRDPIARFRTGGEVRAALAGISDRTGRRVLSELREKERSGHPALAIEGELRAAVAAHDGSVEPLRALASFLARRVRHDEAVIVLERAVARWAESSEAWLDLSLAYRAAGRASDARRAGEQALRLGVPPARQREAAFAIGPARPGSGGDQRAAHVPSPSEVCAERELAGLRDRLNAGDPSEEVEADLRALIQRFPGDGRVYQYLGELLCRMMRTGEAIAVLREGAGRAPHFGPLYWSLGVILQSEGRSGEAAVALRGALGLLIDANMRRNAQMLLRRLEHP